MGAADDPAPPRELAFVDLATTGGSAAHHRITQIGSVSTAPERSVAQWGALVNRACRTVRPARACA